MPCTQRDSPTELVIPARAIGQRELLPTRAPCRVTRDEPNSGPRNHPWRPPLAAHAEAYTHPLLGRVAHALLLGFDGWMAIRSEVKPAVQGTQRGTLACLEGGPVLHAHCLLAESQKSAGTSTVSSKRKKGKPFP